MKLRFEIFWFDNENEKKQPKFCFILKRNRMFLSTHGFTRIKKIIIQPLFLKKNTLFLNDNFNLKTFWSLNLMLFFDFKLKFRFENWFFAVSYFNIFLNCRYLLNQLIIEIDILNIHLRGCLYGSWDEITNGTRQWTKSEEYSHFFTSLLLRLYETGTFFIPSQQGKIPLV